MTESKIEKTYKTLPQIGQIDWMGIRSEKKRPLTEVEQVQVTTEDGLEGDHYKGSSRKRQVTLIQAEHLQAVASILKKETVHPGLTRRNIVVSGINLLAFKDRQFKLGKEVILEMTGLCHPCTRMEENLGAGGLNAMRGHGGITAKVVQGGIIKKGDEVKILRNGE